MPRTGTRLVVLALLGACRALRRVPNGAPLALDAAAAGERAGSGWCEPRPITAVNTPGWEMHSSMTADGTLYFAAIRDNDYDIRRSRLVNGGCQPPENLLLPLGIRSCVRHASRTRASVIDSSRGVLGGMCSLPA